ncbi:MAG: putative porin, partial [Bacteroidota bacterium]
PLASGRNQETNANTGHAERMWRSNDFRVFHERILEGTVTLRIPLYVVFLFPAAYAAGQGTDTTTVTAPDTLAVRDSLRVNFLPDIGRLGGRPDTTSALHSMAFLWTGARTPGDLLMHHPGMYLRALGEPGKPNQLTAAGVDWRGISVLLDGRPLDDPVTGAFSLYELPIEYLEELEVHTGARAFLFANNGTGAVINAVTRQYNTFRPVTKIRFLQGPAEHLLTDGLFTQNISRDVNLMVGVQRHVTDGRYFNARYDSWNIRSRVRYNISDRINIAVSDMYNRHVNGMNGGVFADSTLSIFDEALATVRNRTASQTVTRRDAGLDVIVLPFGDSVAFSTAHMYYSGGEREYHDPEATVLEPFANYSWKVLGASIRQHIRFPVIHLSGGGSVERRRVVPESLFADPEKTSTTLFGSAELRLLDPVLVPRVSVRQESYSGAATFSHGADISFRPFPFLMLTVAGSESYRYPTFQEFNWYSYQFTQPDRNILERHRVVEAGFRLASAPSFHMTGTVTRRIVSPALVYRAAPSATSRFPDVMVEVHPELRITSITMNGMVTLGPFSLNATGTYLELEEQTGLSGAYPKLFGSAEFAYREQFFGGSLDSRISVRVRGFTKHRGMQFVPSLLFYVPNTGAEIPRAGIVDLSGVFRLGDAFVNLTWENLPGIQYFHTAVYPMLGSNVKIGINWLFLD